MILRARRKLLAGVIGITMAVAGAATAAVAQPGGQPAEAVAQQSGTRVTAPPSAVEDFAYPDAARLLEDKGITLKRGDGHIVLSDCADANILVRTTHTNDDGNKYCFKSTGKKGYLSLEVPKVYSVDSEGPAFQATVTSEDGKKTVQVEKGGFQPVGTGDLSPGASGKPAVLVELRVNGN
ncbi:hypothetical protein AB0N81_41835 [Streptomyces sp. NPDC093510]|uniref:hypothetical protein n=1 Tax=Streptomyces sp. NPDC093510 TaxID=3155199 RepID=UPI00344A027B